MSDVERADMGSQAEASSSSKRDMGSSISTMKPSDVKTLTRKYKIPRDLHPVAISSEWIMDRLTDEYIGLYEQYFEFVGLRVPFSTFLLAVIRHFHVHISQLVPLGDWFSFEKRAYSDKKMNAEYERLFSKTYSYVDRISHLSEKPVQDLLKLHPAPPPRDAPKAGSGGIVFAPKLVKAAEVARSKDTASQDPASHHASGGSKAPPSKKT
ncbi:hypothetical protein Tco_0834896 [Tanacetum coccineum]